MPDISGLLDGDEIPMDVRIETPRRHPGDKHYIVLAHSFILRNQSSFFRNKLEESRNYQGTTAYQTIVLTDSVVNVERMVKFMYSDTYPSLTVSEMKSYYMSVDLPDGSRALSSAMDDPKHPKHSNFCWLHMDMICLGNKYGVKGLQKYATAQFRKDLHGWLPDRHKPTDRAIAKVGKILCTVYERGRVKAENHDLDEAESEEFNVSLLQAFGKKWIKSLIGSGEQWETLCHRVPDLAKDVATIWV